MFKDSPSNCKLPIEFRDILKGIENEWEIRVGGQPLNPIRGVIALVLVINPLIIKTSFDGSRN